MVAAMMDLATSGGYYIALVRLGIEELLPILSPGFYYPWLAMAP